jgi:hypothetical protein
VGAFSVPCLCFPVVFAAFFVSWFARISVPAAVASMWLACVGMSPAFRASGSRAHGERGLCLVHLSVPCVSLTYC